MGHSSSAQKRERQNQKRHVRNVANRRALKKVIKKFDATLAEDAAAAEKSLPEINKALSIAARKGAVPKKRAARKLGRLAKAVNRKKAGKTA